jgi:hypothetical protein
MDPAQTRLRVVIGMTSPEEARLARFSISPALRRYVTIKPMPQTRRATLNDQDAVNEAMVQIGIKPFTSEIEDETGKIVVAVESQAAAETARTRLPKNKAIVEVIVRPIPAPTQAQSSPVTPIEASVIYTAVFTVGRQTSFRIHKGRTITRAVPSHSLLVGGPPSAF